MGNSQTSEPKAGRAKVKTLMKIRKRGPKAEPPFTAVVPEERMPETPQKSPPKNNSNLLVTESWCEANAAMSPPAVSSSSDSNFTDPVAAPEEDVSLEDVRVPSRTPSQETFLHNLALNSFKLNEHRARHEEELTKKLSKLGVSRTSQISLDGDNGEGFTSENVELVADEGTLKRRPKEKEHRAYDRHMSVPLELVGATQEGAVLKKVASLTLNKGDLEARIVKPKFVPEKLDFQLYEKFEGYMLVNWYLSEFGEDHHLVQSASNQDLKLLAIQFCTHLLAAGVLRQISDKDVPTCNIFKPDCMYYWTHAEVAHSVPQTPGRLSLVSWPPVSPCDASTEDYQDALGTPLKPQEFKSSARDVEILALEEEVNRLKQEVEKYQTVIDIQNLTAKTVQDFESPVHETKPICDSTLLLVNQSVQTDQDENAQERRSIETQTEEAQVKSEEKKLTPKVEESLKSQNEAPPPPPMPEIVVTPPPPPPPMMGGVPPPPPIMGGIPPPPPMMGGVPPPPPMMGGIPPPPPMMGGIPPPPPIMGGIPPPPPMMGGVPPPPPMMGGVPPPPPMGGPVPLPPPPAGGWSSQKEVAPPHPVFVGLRKPVLNPTVPMKPLYWTRILATNPVDVIDGPSEALWSQIDELPLETLSDFTDLFSRQVLAKKSAVKKEEQKPKVAVAKLLDSKRSQNVGILAQSLHVDFQEIENAVYHFDTSVISLEALQQIYEVRANPEELSLIKQHLETKPEESLDKPEQFLLELSDISNFAERISSLMFQVEFDDSIGTIGHTLANIKTTCEYLMNNADLKEVFAIILTLGNYMNGGNMSRGQADGFGLEILPKLKDVKSKDSKITLLHFIVKVYMRKLENPLEPNLILPVPEPLVIRRASCVNFDDVKVDLLKLEKQLTDCERKSTKVIEASTEANLQPFKDKMVVFLEESKKQLAAEWENLEECKAKFLETMKFYLFKPKSGTLEEYRPNSFFEMWLPFCTDFKDIFEKELIRIQKEKIQDIKKRQKERHDEIVIVKKRENGLKSKIQKIQAKQASRFES